MVGGVTMRGGAGKDYLNGLYIGAGYQQSLRSFTVRNLSFGTALRFCTDHLFASNNNKKGMFEIQALKPLPLMSQPDNPLTWWPESCKTETEIS